MEKVNYYDDFKPLNRIRIPTEKFKLEVEIEVFKSIGARLCNSEYLMTPQIKPIIDELLRYLNCINCEFDDKGIAFLGPTGTGKSRFFDIIREYTIQRNIKYFVNDKLSVFKYKQFSAHEVVARFARNGFDGLEPFTFFNNIQFDDVGAENVEAKNFGNKVNAFQYIFEERYRKNQLTHFTSNLTLNDIRNNYGDRVYSRLHEMVHFIEVNDEDFRLNRKLV